MSKGKIRIKPLRAMGSLAQRALLVSLCLLVIPLFFHSFFLYRSEYQETLADAKENLTLAVKAQKAILEQRIHLQWQMLDGGGAAFEVSKPPGLPDYFAFIDLEKHALYVGKEISKGRAIAVANPMDEVFDQLTNFEKASYPFFLAFVDREGHILIGTKQKTTLAVEIPVAGTNFSLYLSIPEGAIQKLHQAWYVYHFLSLLFFVGIIGGLIVYLMTRRIGRPLNQLCKVMEKVGEGATQIRYIPDRMGFEINELGKQFNQTLDQVLEKSKEAEKQRIGRERLEEELKIGRDIQASLLPKDLPHVKELDMAAEFLPAQEVGGDFYDLFPMEGGKLLIAMADTAGKGISACLYSLGLRSILRTLASRGEETLSEIVLRANDLFWRDAEPTGMFVTLWIGLYHLPTKTLEYCSQGHPPAYLVRKGECVKLWTAGIALGAQAFDQIPTKREILEIGDLLVFYTDGVIEAHNRDNQLFGSQRLEAFLKSANHLSSTRLLKDLRKELELFAQDTSQHDDIAVLAMKVLDLDFVHF